MDKYLKEIIRESMKSMTWAKNCRTGSRGADREKYDRYYKQSRCELAGLYLLDGRAIITTGYEEYIPLIRETYREYGQLIKSNIQIQDRGIYPELVSVRIKKYRYLRKGLKLLYEELTK